jgi:hypothetical protein
VAEYVERWSFLKFPYYKKLGWPGGVYRVGPLGRLNAAQKMATPLAQVEYEVFEQLRGGKVVEGTLYYHYARLIEDLYAVENVRVLLEDPDILGRDIQNVRPVTNAEGVGVIEAPRGTLWHHYWVDEDGKLEKVNLIVATGNNNWAMTTAGLGGQDLPGRQERHGGRAEPHRGRHPGLRPLPLVQHARDRPDAAGAGVPGRGGERSGPLRPRLTRPHPARQWRREREALPPIAGRQGFVLLLRISLMGLGRSPQMWPPSAVLDLPSVWLYDDWQTGRRQATRKIA